MNPQQLKQLIQSKRDWSEPLEREDKEKGFKIWSLPLEKVLQSWKGHTSKAANKIFGRQGTLWQEDYFDRKIL